MNNGKPVVLGMQTGTILNPNFHVVVAYGYAKLDGVDGYLVHCGWGDQVTMAWVPESWFRFQVTMDVNTHTHNCSVDEMLERGHAGLICSICNATLVDNVYTVVNGEISTVKYQLKGNCPKPTCHK